MSRRGQPVLRDAVFARFVKPAIPVPNMDMIGCPAHQAVADRIKRLADPDGVANFAFAEKERFILAEERTFLRTVDGA